MARPVVTEAFGCSPAVLAMPLRLRFAPLACLALLLAGCLAHQRPRADGEQLKKSVEDFARMLRWGDLRGAARYLAPEGRLEFTRGVLERRDEDLLRVSDLELADAQIGGGQALFLYRISWSRLPSVTVQSDSLLLEWKVRDDAWVLVAMRGGPLPFAAAPSPGLAAPSAAGPAGTSASTRP